MSAIKTWCVKCPRDGTASTNKELPKMLLHVKTGIAWDDYYSSNGYKVVPATVTEGHSNDC